MIQWRSLLLHSGLVLAWLLLCLVPSAESQVNASGVFHADTLNLQAPIVTLPSAAAAVSISASTTGSLSCSVYPVVKVYAIRGVQNLDLADFTAIGAGSSWVTALNFIPLQQGDQVYAQLTTAGTSCSNDVPLTVSLVYVPAAGICYANPSACVDVVGYLGAANGLPSSNYTATFALNQVGFLGGVPPASASSGGTVTGFSAGNLSPLFTTSVGSASTTPTLNFLASNFAADNIFGNFSGSSAAPSTQAIPACASDGTHALTYAGHTLGCTAVGAANWPAGGAGIPNYSGSSSWSTSYNALNKIPFNFLTGVAADSAVVHNTGNEAVAGIKTFSSQTVFSAGITTGTGPLLIQGSKQSGTPTIEAGQDFGWYVGTDNLFHCLLSAALGSGSCLGSGSGNVSTSTANSYTGGTGNLQDFSAVATKQPTGSNTAQNSYGGTAVWNNQKKGGVITYNFVSTNDATGWGAALKNAFAAAADGDDIHIHGAGMLFNVGTCTAGLTGKVCLDGSLGGTGTVLLHGDGEGTNEIYTAYAGGNDSLILQLGLGSTSNLADYGGFTVRSTVAPGICDSTHCVGVAGTIGRAGSFDAPVINARMHNVNLVGVSDVFNLFADVGSTAVLEHCHMTSQWDTLTSSTTSAKITLNDCPIVAVGNPANGSGASGIKFLANTDHSPTSTATIDVYNTPIAISGSGALLGATVNNGIALNLHPGTRITNTSGVSVAIGNTSSTSVGTFDCGVYFDIASKSGSGTFTYNPCMFQGKAVAGVSGTGSMVLAQSPTIDSLTVTGGCTGCGGSGSPGGGDKQGQFDDAGSFGGDPDWLYDKATHIHSTTSSGIFDFHLASVLNGFLPPSGALASPTANGACAFDTSNHNQVCGNGSTTNHNIYVTGATPSAGVLHAAGSTYATTGGPVTSSDVNNTIALTGTDINTSNQVTATHLASALPVNQGGTATTTSTGTGNVVLSSGPTLTNPAVGTQSANDNSTKAASTAYVDGKATAPGSAWVGAAGADPVCDSTNDSGYTCTGVGTSRTYYAHSITIPTAATAGKIDGVHNGLKIFTQWNNGGAGITNTTYTLSACSAYSAQVCTGEVVLWSSGTASIQFPVSASCILGVTSTATTLSIACNTSGSNFTPNNSSTVVGSVPNSGSNWVLIWSVQFNTGSQVRGTSQNLLASEFAF